MSNSHANQGASTLSIFNENIKNEEWASNSAGSVIMQMVLKRNFLDGWLSKLLRQYSARVSHKFCENVYKRYTRCNSEKLNELLCFDDERKKEFKKKSSKEMEENENILWILKTSVIMMCEWRNRIIVIDLHRLPWILFLSSSMIVQYLAF